MSIRTRFTCHVLAASLAGLGLFELPLEGQGIGITTPSPSVVVRVEPEEDGKVVYAPVAAGTSDDSGADDQAHLALKLVITNTGGSTLRLKTTTVSFLGPPFAAGAVFSTDTQIVAGATVEVHVQNNLAYPGENFNFQLSHPPPPGVTLNLKFDG
jgi:hypothetical protein